MRKLALFASFIGTMCCGLLAAASVQAQTSGNSTLVNSVTSVDVTLDKSQPPGVLVKAKGMVPTGGYTNPRLVMVLYVVPPADGIQDLDFLADPPSPGTIVTQAFTSVETPLLNMGPAPKWLKGIRVRARTNKIEKPCC